MAIDTQSKRFSMLGLPEPPDGSIDTGDERFALLGLYSDFADGVAPEEQLRFISRVPGLIGNLIETTATGPFVWDDPTLTGGQGSVKDAFTTILSSSQMNADLEQTILRILGLGE